VISPSPKAPRTRRRFALHDGLGILRYRVVVDIQDGRGRPGEVLPGASKAHRRAQAPEKKRSLLLSVGLRSNHIKPPFLSLHGNVEADMPLVVRRQPSLCFVSGVSTCFPAVPTACPLFYEGIAAAPPLALGPQHRDGQFPYFTGRRPRMACRHASEALRWRAESPCPLSSQMRALG